MRFHLENKVVIVVEFYDAGIVHENGKAEILFSFGPPDFFRGSLDVGFKKRVDGLLLLAVRIINVTVEYFVFAVFRPGLGEAFHFHIRDVFPEAFFLPSGNDSWIKEVVANGLHFVKVQRQNAFSADGHEIVVSGIGKTDFFNDRFRFAGHLRDIGRDAADRVEVSGEKNLIPLD